MKVYEQLDDAWIDEARERIKQEVDIEEFIIRHDLGEISRDGKMCCPIHDESGPSCFVDTSKQEFKCFGCGKGGTVVELWMGVNRAHTDNQFFSQKRAITEIAREYGVILPKRNVLVEVGTRIGKVERGAYKNRELSLDEKKVLIFRANDRISKFSKSKQRVVAVGIDLLLEGRNTHEQIYKLFEKKGIVKGSKLIY